MNSKSFWNTPRMLLLKLESPSKPAPLRTILFRTLALGGSMSRHPEFVSTDERVASTGAHDRYVSNLSKYLE